MCRILGGGGESGEVGGVGVSVWGEVEKRGNRKEERGKRSEVG